MRISAVIGSLLIILGVILLVTGGSFTTQREVLRVGDVKVTAPDRQTLPPWAGGLAIAGGIVLVIAGVRRRSA